MIFLQNKTVTFLTIAKLVIFAALVSAINIPIHHYLPTETVYAFLLHMVTSFAFVIGFISIIRNQLKSRYTFLPFVVVNDRDHRIVSYNHEFSHMTQAYHGELKKDIKLERYLSNNSDLDESDIKRELSNVDYPCPECPTLGTTNLLLSITTDDLSEISVGYSVFTMNSPTSIFSFRRSEKIYYFINNTELLTNLKNAEALNSRKRKLLNVISSELRSPIATSVMIVESDEFDKPVMKKNLLELLDHSLDIFKLLDSIAKTDDSTTPTSSVIEDISIYNTHNSLTEHVNELYLTEKPLFVESGVNLTTKNLRASTAELHKFKYSYDKSIVSEILTTFIENSLIHSRAHDVAIISHIDEVKNGSAKITISVEDNGIGIKNSTRDLIFEGLYQQSSASSLSMGMGLSLYHAKMLACKLPNGVVSCTDPLMYNFGIRFSLSFTAPAVASESVKASEKVERFSFDGKRVVIVDDVGLLRILLTKILTKEGAYVRDFSEGKAAFEYIQTSDDSVDIVLTDLMMPEYDGRYLIRNLKSINYDNPIIVMTGNTTHSDSQFSKLIELGADSVITKPISLDMLTETITKINYYKTKKDNKKS